MEYVPNLNTWADLVDRLIVCVNKLNIDDALKADSLEDAKKVASRRSTIVSVIVSAVSVLLGAWLQKIFQLQ